VKKTTKKTTASFILLILSFYGFSQNITGKITDNGGHPIFDVQVINKTTNDHSHSDESGIYFLKEVSKGDTIIFSHLVYKTSRVIIDGMALSINVVMSDDFISLDQVVISPITGQI